MNHPSMTARGKQLAALIGITIAFFLPKKVECGYPGAQCATTDRLGAPCTRYELEPWGFYLIESVAHGDVGFAYASGDDCH
jgi:hypothetical protein